MRVSIRKSKVEVAQWLSQPWRCTSSPESAKLLACLYAQAVQQAGLCDGRQWIDRIFADTPLPKYTRRFYSTVALPETQWSLHPQTFAQLYLNLQNLTLGLFSEDRSTWKLNTGPQKFVPPCRMASQSPWSSLATPHRLLRSEAKSQKCSTLLFYSNGRLSMSIIWSNQAIAHRRSSTRWMGGHLKYSDTEFALHIRGVKSFFKISRGLSFYSHLVIAR